jgi:LL-diaminopimelate aminotransferase
LPDLKELDGLLEKHKPRFMILNYPSNPTTATISREKLTEIVRLARKHNTLIAYDNAYSEMYYSESDKPLSILEIPGAKDVAIEFQSLSKTFNMTGWRLGFAVGNADLIKGLLKAKTNIDSGPLLSVQEAGSWALEHADELASPIRAVYAERRAAVLSGLEKLGIEYFAPKATFFVWARVPNGKPSMDFCRELIEQQGLVVTPGMGFGVEGEGYFRLAMTVDSPRIREAMTRLAKYLGR